PTWNCSTSRSSRPSRASAWAVADPMIPAPTTMTSACTGLSLPSAERQCDLHVQRVVEAVEIDLAWRPTRLAAVLLRPAIHGLVGTEDLRGGALLGGDRGEGAFAGRQALVAVALRNADLDGPVFLVVHGPVIEHERVAALGLSQLLERRDDERLQLGNEDSLRATDVRLLRDLPGENVVHGLLLQDAFDVAENPAPFGELVGHTPLVRLEELDARLAEERADLGARQPAAAQQRDQRRLPHLLERVVAVTRGRVDPRRWQEALLPVQAESLLREPRRGGELADRHEVLHVVQHDGPCPRG